MTFPMRVTGLMGLCAALASSADLPALRAQDATPSQAAEAGLRDGQRDLEAGRLEDAEREFFRALALDPTRDEVLIDLARLHIRVRAFKESEEELRSYLRAHPDAPLALGLAGEVKFRERDF